MNTNEMQIMQVDEALRELQTINNKLVALNEQIHTKTLEHAEAKAKEISLKAELSNLKSHKQTLMQLQNNLKAIIKAG